MTPAAMRKESQAQLAERLGVAARTLRDWRDREDFQAAWREAFNEVAGSLAKTKQILDVLFEDATGATDPGDRARASKLYYDIAKQIAPPEPEPEKSKKAAELSDEELADMLSEHALALLEERGCIVQVREVAV